MTPRQQQVYDLAIQGKSNKEIGRDLGIVEGTVKIHLSVIFKEQGVSTRYQLIARSKQEGV